MQTLGKRHLGVTRPKQPITKLYISFFMSYAHWLSGVTRPFLKFTLFRTKFTPLLGKFTPIYTRWGPGAKSTVNPRKSPGWGWWCMLNLAHKLKDHFHLQNLHRAPIMGPLRRGPHTLL